MTDEELKQLVAANAKAISELRISTGDLRASISELRTSTGDLRTSISALRDIVTGHERRIIRLEGKEIDIWGDYLTLLDRIKSLEEWKRKIEGQGQ